MVVADIEAEIQAEQERVREIWKPSDGNSISLLKMTLGTSLMNSNTKVSELIKSWSTDSRGRSTGQISLVDFRKHVRNVIEWQNVKDIDAIFAEVDSDGDGSLDISELTVFMRTLRDKADSVQAAANASQARIDYWRQRGDFAQGVLEATSQAEKAECMLEKELDNTAVAARLGKEMLRKATKIADLVSSWDSTDGHMDRRQFRKNVRTFGVSGDDTSIDELFNNLDKDGDGTVDSDELRSAMSKLRDAALESDKEAQRLRKLVETSWKAAKAAQIELRKRRKADEAEAKAKQEKDELEAEAAAKAAEEAKAAKAARALAKKQREVEEKEAYEAKIATRRKSNAGR